MSRQQITTDEALEVFARGFSFTRSFTHPYIPEQVEEGVWLLRDVPRSRGEYRKDEYLACGVSPASLQAIAKKHSSGRYQICALLKNGESDCPLRGEFKDMGYRLVATEDFMANDLSRLQSLPGPLPIKRIETEAEAAQLAKAARTRQILPEHLKIDPPPMREYVATDEGGMIGWVGSISVGSFRWCANMFVLPTYRRRGVARSLMTHMLQEDKAAGAKANILTASHAGSKLYPLVGYRPLGTFYLYVPPRG